MLKYVEKDSIIKLFQHESNHDVTWNYNFLLKNAKCKYFVWAAVDDLWEPTFLDENIQILQNNEKIVCSFSKTNFYSLQKDSSINKIDSSFNRFLIKLKYFFRKIENISIKGSYDQKVRLFLKKSTTYPFFGVFRTDAIQKSYTSKGFVGNDIATILSVLKYGDIHVIDKNLISVYDGGMSKKGIISFSHQFNDGILGVIFPMLPLTSWCKKNLGNKIYFKNFDYFFILNVWGSFSILLDILRIFLNKISKN